MKRRFIARALMPQRVDEAYPLARAAVPGLTLERWRRFGRDATASAGKAAHPEILLVENDHGYIQGLCTYHLLHDLRHGIVMVVDHLAMIDLIDGAVVAEALLAALDALARQAGCGRIQLNLQQQATGGRPALYELLRAEGHALDAWRMSKPLDAGPAGP
jgi:hypothetical protein